MGSEQCVHSSLKQLCVVNQGLAPKRAACKEVFATSPLLHTNDQSNKEIVAESNIQSDYKNSCVQQSSSTSTAESLLMLVV